MDESWDDFRARIDGLTLGQLRFEWVALVGQLRRLSRECEQVHATDPPSDLSGLIARYRIIDQRLGYVDDLLLERDDLTKVDA